MKNRTLIAYGTRMGATAKATCEIAQVLRDKCGFEVDIINLEKNRSLDLAEYKNFIIGSGIAWENGSRMSCSSQKTSLKVRKYPRIEPITTEAFGGHIGFLGFTFVDDRDMGKIRSWADEVGKKFSELNNNRKQET